MAPTDRSQIHPRFMMILTLRGRYIPDFYDTWYAWSISCFTGWDDGICRARQRSSCADMFAGRNLYPMDIAQHILTGIAVLGIGSAGVIIWERPAFCKPCAVKCWTCIARTKTIFHSPWVSNYALSHWQVEFPTSFFFSQWCPHDRFFGKDSKWPILEIIWV